MYGPKGIGVLYVRRSPPVRIAAQIHGGGHERGMRSGTLATHQIVGMGEASRILRENMDDRERAHRGIAKPFVVAPETTRRRAGQRRSRAAPARQPERLVRRYRRRNIDDGARRRRGIERFGVYVGDRRAVVCVARDRRSRRSRARVVAIHGRPVHDRRRHRSCRASRHRSGRAICANATPPDGASARREWPRRRSALQATRNAYNTRPLDHPYYLVNSNR